MSDYWYIDFVVYTDDYEEKVCAIDGKIAVKAVDIFEALRLANDKLKTFGFSHIVINGGRRKNNEEEN